MEILKKIPESVFKTLEAKGVSKETIENKLKEFEVEGKELFPNNVDDYMLNRIDTYFSSVMSQPDMTSFEAIVIGVGKISDDNEISRRTSKKYADQGILVDEWDKVNKCKTGNKIPAKEGFYAFGFNQGEPIPTTPSFSQDFIVSLELDSKVVQRTLVYKGDWLNKRTINSGDEIKFFMVKDDKLKGNLMKEKIYPRNEFEKTNNTYTEEEIKTFLNTHFKDYIKTGKEIIDSNHTGFVITKGNVSTVNGSNWGYKVSFKDNSVMFSMENVITTTIPNNVMNLQENAMDVIFIGNIRRDNDNKLVLDYMGSIVPEVYKRVEISEEQVSEVANNVTLEEENLLDSIDVSGEDILL